MGINPDHLSPSQRSLISPKDRFLLPSNFFSHIPTHSSSEAHHQALFAKALKFLDIPFVWHRTDKRSTASPGCPDFIVVLPDGISYWIEFKTLSSATLDPLQVLFRNQLLAHNHLHHVALSHRHALAILSNSPSPTPYLDSYA
jgi:hypothetical protein